MAVDSSLARLKKVSSLRPCPAEQRLEGLVDSAVGLLGYLNVPCAVDSVPCAEDFAVGLLGYFNVPCAVDSVVGLLGYSPWEESPRRCRR